MRFLIDAQLPPALGRWLEARGHEALHIGVAMAGDTPDAAVAEFAEAEGLILVTKDEDFATAFETRDFRLLWLRCGNTTNASLSTWLDARWAMLEQLLERGEALIEVR